MLACIKRDDEKGAFSLHKYGTVATPFCLFVISSLYSTNRYLAGLYYQLNVLSIFITLSNSITIILILDDSVS